MVVSSHIGASFAGSRTTSPLTPRTVSSSMSSASRSRLVRSSTVSPFSRPPAVLELSESSLRCGIVGGNDGDVVLRPKDLLPFYNSSSTEMSAASSTTTTVRFGSSHRPPATATADVWYRWLTPLVQQAYHRLGLGAKDRKVVVFLDKWAGPSVRQNIPRALEEAIETVLLRNIGVPAMCLQSSLAVIPYSLPMLSSMMIVWIGLTEACCMIHSMGESLPFTFQSVPLEPLEGKPDDTDYLFTDVNNPTSVLNAMLKALEACPMLVRKEVIANLVIVGHGLLTQPDLPVILARKLQAMLRATEDPAEQSPSSTRGPYPHILGMVSVSLPSMRGLAESVGLIDTRPYRPDLVAWAGASLWAARWHSQDPLLKKLPWKQPTPPV